MKKAKSPQIRSGMYKLVLKRLRQIERCPNSGIIRFPDVFEKLCRNFSITKEECWDILLTLNEFGVIQIIPCHGIRINCAD